MYSLCGVHTHLELLAEAKRLGMHALAITDHGPALGGRVNSVFFDRFVNPFDGVRLLKGMECNLAKEKGGIDLPAKYLPYMDVVLLGIHHNTEAAVGSAVLTDLLCTAMRQNPCVDIITHLNDPSFPVNFAAVAACAAQCGMAIELNNSKTLNKRTTPEMTAALVDACAQAGCLVAVTGDAHVITELGRDEAVQPYLVQCAFPPELVVTRSAESALGFIERRRQYKKAK